MSEVSPGRGERGDPGLREYLSALRRYWLVAGTVFLLAVLASAAATWLVDPVYRAQAEVLIRTEQSDQLFPRSGRSANGRLARSPVAELEYTTSDGFQERARAAAAVDATVDVRHDSDDSSLLVFQGESQSAEEAAAAANAWASTYVTVRHEKDLQEIRGLRDVLVADRDAAAGERQRVLEPVTRLDEVLAQTTDSLELSRLLNQRLALERSLSGVLDPLDDRLQSLNEQVTTLDVDARVLEQPDALAYVSQTAEAPESRVNGSLARNLAVGVVVGLLLAAATVTAARSLFRA